MGLFQVQISKCFHLVLFIGFLAEFTLQFRVSTRIVSNFGLPSSCLLTAERICTGSIGHSCRSPFTLMIHSLGLSLPLQADFLPRIPLDCVSSKGSYISLEAFQLSAHRGQLWRRFLPYEDSVLALFVRGRGGAFVFPFRVLVCGRQYRAWPSGLPHFRQVHLLEMGLLRLLKLVPSSLAFPCGFYQVWDLKGCFFLSSDST